MKYQGDFKNELTELEKMLSCCEKLLKDAIEKKPKSGYIIDENNRMKYKDALEAIHKLDTYFGLKGTSSTSFGLCMTCSNWDTRAHTSLFNCCGSCKIKSSKRDFHPELYHSYDTCSKHSLEGGGRGL